MENKLEQLLNSLIEKGWKPFGFIVYNIRKGPYNSKYYFFENCADGKTLRQVVSIESGLWQFVCENKLTTLQIEYNNRKPPERGIRYHWNKHSNVMQENERLTKERKRNENYEYRLIESALKDGSELESFILDNIKVGNE